MSSEATPIGWCSSIDQWFEENQYTRHHDNEYVQSEDEAQYSSNGDQALSEDTMSQKSIGTVAEEDKGQLIKTIRDGINRCKQAIRDSHVKRDNKKEEERQLHEAELQALEESRKRIKTQELILSKRMEIHVRLPTNQIVTPAHNALIEEDTKESILITESFKAIKDEKANVRTKLASRLDEMEEAHTRDCAALKQADHLSL